MNIYLISRRNLQCGYDEMKGFVVVAESLSKARGFAAENAGREGTKFWWHNRTSVGYCIGRAAENVKAGVMLSSFSAG